jgi:hypothetical protein
VPNCATVLIAVHHTVFDGFSIRILGHEIGTVAAALEQGRPHDLPDLPLQYADYALWQEELRPVRPVTKVQAIGNPSYRMRRILRLNQISPKRSGWFGRANHNNAGPSVPRCVCRAFCQSGDPSQGDTSGCPGTDRSGTARQAAKTRHAFGVADCGHDPARGPCAPLCPLVPPVDPLPRQARLAEILSDVLGLPASQCDGDFFDLGGHSILVLRMLSRVQAEFGAWVSLVEFMENPTLKGVAAGIDKALGTSAEDNSATNREVITLRNGQPGEPVIVSINQPFLYHNIAHSFDDRYRVINLHISNERYFEAETATPLADIVSDAAQKIEAEAAGRPIVLMGQCVDGLMGLSIAHLAPATRRHRRIHGKLRRWGQYIRLKASREIGWQAFFSKSSATSKVLVPLADQRPPPAPSCKRFASMCI